MTEQSTPREWVDVDTFAALIGVSRWTIARMAREGQFGDAAFKLGKPWRFHKDNALTTYRELQRQAQEGRA